MNCRKVSGSYNEYKLELSFGELEAIYRAMETDHSDPIADEVFNGLKWYIDQGNVPLPGEETEKGKKDKDKGGNVDVDHMLDDPDEFVSKMDDDPAPSGPRKGPSGPAPKSLAKDADDDVDSMLEEPPDA